jgi:hypothetical protein
MKKTGVKCTIGFAAITAARGIRSNVEEAVRIAGFGDVPDNWKASKGQNISKLSALGHSIFAQAIVSFNHLGSHGKKLTAAYQISLNGARDVWSIPPVRGALRTEKPSRMQILEEYATTERPSAKLLELTLCSLIDTVPGLLAPRESITLICPDVSSEAITYSVKSDVDTQAPVSGSETGTPPPISTATGEQKETEAAIERENLIATKTASLYRDFDLSRMRRTAIFHSSDRVPSDVVALIRTIPQIGGDPDAPDAAFMAYAMSTLAEYLSPSPANQDFLLFDVMSYLESILPED